MEYNHAASATTSTHAGPEQTEVDPERPNGTPFTDLELAVLDAVDIAMADTGDPDLAHAAIVLAADRLLVGHRS